MLDITHSLHMAITFFQCHSASSFLTQLSKYRTLLSITHNSFEEKKNKKHFPECTRLLLYQKSRVH